MTKKKSYYTPKKAFRIDRDSLVADIDAGLTNEQMAEKHLCSEATVKVYLARYGLKRKREKPHPTDEAIRACLQQKMGVRAIARKLGAAEWYIADRARLGGMRKQPEQRQVTVTYVRRPEPSPAIFINERGVSLPRVPTIHGHYEVRP